MKMSENLLELVENLKQYCNRLEDRQSPHQEEHSTSQTVADRRQET